MAKTWYCKDCLQHNCPDKLNNPHQIAKIDGDKYCNKFWNPLSEPAFEKGRTNEKVCNGNCGCDGKCHS